MLSHKRAMLLLHAQALDLIAKTFLPCFSINVLGLLIFGGVICLSVQLDNVKVQLCCDCHPELRWSNQQCC